MEFIGKIINPWSGIISGPALVSKDRISFLGDVDPVSGKIRAPDSDIYGETITSKILVFRGGRGSTVGAMVIYALKKNGKAPLALITVETDPVVVSGAIFSDIPAVSEVSEKILDSIVKNDVLRIRILDDRAIIEVIKNVSD